MRNIGDTWVFNQSKVNFMTFSVVGKSSSSNAYVLIKPNDSRSFEIQIYPNAARRVDGIHLGMLSLPSHGNEALSKICLLPLDTVVPVNFNNYLEKLISHNASKLNDF